jgi:hypothetical protein
MRWISYTCFTVGLISVIFASTLSIQAIWLEASEDFIRGIATCGVLILACLIVLTFNEYISYHRKSESR